MIIYQISLPKDKDTEAFVKFMQDEYFPAVHKGATRVGQVTSLELLQGGTADTTHEFFWHVGWNGLSSGEPRVSDEAVRRKFDSFSLKVVRVGFFQEVVAWREIEG